MLSTTDLNRQLAVHPTKRDKRALRATFMEHVRAYARVMDCDPFESVPDVIAQDSTAALALRLLAESLQADNPQSN